MLPKAVLDEEAKAKFDKKRKVLKLTLPVNVRTAYSSHLVRVPLSMILAACSHVQNSASGGGGSGSQGGGGQGGGGQGGDGQGGGSQGGGGKGGGGRGGG